jgi:putative ABC transport system permease protein
MRNVPFVLRLSLRILRLIGALVPAAARVDWLREWEAEVHHRSMRLAALPRHDWRHDMDLFRRALGALPDAAWLRRQFTADAEIVQDVRYGARALRQTPTFAVSAILILALGIGGTVAIVTLLDTLLIRGLPYREADRVVTVWQRTRAAEKDDVAPANFLDWRDRARSFSHIAAAHPHSYDYTAGGEPEVLFGAMVSEGFFDAVGVQPVAGRSFTADDFTQKRKVAVITWGLWQRRFGGDPGLVDRVVTFEDEPWMIVGILPRDFAPELLPRPRDIEVWTPKIFQTYEKNIRSSAWWNVVARLNVGVTIEQAQAEMDAISTALGREYPRTNNGVRAVLTPLRDHMAGPVRTPLFIMLGAVVLVLAIGCANVASLLLARGMQREREFAVRAALGAGRGRIVRQLITESLLLSGLACAAGIALAHAGIRLLVSLAPGQIDRLQEAAIDGRVLAFAAVLSTATAIAFGLAPALQLSRPDHDAIRERTTTGANRTTRRALIVAEVAFALVLLAGAGLLIRSFGRLMSVDPGFSPKKVVALQVFAWDRATTPDRLRAFFGVSLDRLRALPGVEEAGAVSAMPFISANIDIRSEMSVIGRPQARDGDARGVFLTIATPGYFRAMSIPMKAGRSFDERDTAATAPVVVITEALRRRDWPAADPIGSRVEVQWQGQPHQAEIIGVVGDLRHDGLDRGTRPEMFLPHDQLPFGSMTYVMRAAGDPAALIEASKREVWAVNPQQTFYDAATVDGLIDASVVRQRFSTTLMAVFALFALILCATGIYGVLSFTMGQRTREIGVRMALGADAASIRRMVLGEGAAVIAVGVGVGLAGALVATRLLQTLLFEIRPGDPLTLLSVSAVLSMVGLAACYVPARRATRIDPLVALRTE